MMKNVYIVGGGFDYIAMWTEFGWNVVNRREKADLFQFTGGEDVSPNFYGEPIHPYAACNSLRDEVEAALFNYALLNGTPMTGICRGGQFLNVMSGGKMFQHCDGHGIGGTHEAIIQDTGVRVQVTSTHHQIMRPHEDAIVLMEAEKLGTFKEHVKYDPTADAWCKWNEPDAPDIEAIYYPTTGALCYQPHPEYCKPDSDCVKAYKYFLRNYLDVDV